MEGVQTNLKLKQLHLAINDAGDEIIPVLIATVFSHPSLEVLDISYNRLTNAGAEDLLHAVMATVAKKSMGALRNLIVKRNQADEGLLEQVGVVVFFKGRAYALIPTQDWT